MAIGDKLRAQILHFVEYWRVGTIASQRCLI